MLIPSLDLMGGRLVQLVQGRELALEEPDVFAWVDRFAAYPEIQVIDLDAAIGRGDNWALVAEICRRARCRVGGGIRSVARAREAIEAGAAKVIAGSALFEGDRVATGFASALAEAVGVDAVIAAIDSLGGRVAIEGWRRTLDLATTDAARALEPWCAEFLYTHIATEGMLRGIDMDAARAVRQATTRRVTVAGGVSSLAEVRALEAIGVDAVVGMAIYTGKIPIAKRA